MPRIPFGPIRVEYRGVAPAGEFVNDDRETVAYGPKLKFELPLPDGDVETVAIPQMKLDQVADFDVSKLTRGDEVMIEGVVSYGAGYAGLRPLICRRAVGPASVKAA